MLKLPKGLKKKKKSKKNKELFTEEELEQYKRDQKAKQEAEQQQQQQVEQAQYSERQSTSGLSKQKTEDDEWSKFKQLTTGIDSVLKKTQVDLDRIKEESFFQRIDPKKAEPEPQPVDAEPQQPQLTAEELEEQRKLEQLKAAVVELSESEDEDSDGADDIFDTNYINELASGKLPLAYVPDSPDTEDLGPDPFDTGYADRVIKGPEVSKRGKKIVNIGSAVQVLTGRVDNVSAKKEALRRPRRGPQNLLLRSFDLDPEADDADETDKPAEEARPVLTLLDDASDIIADIPIDLSAPLHLDFLRKQEAERKEAERLRKELERDEFDELAAESLTKREEVVVLDASVLIAAPLVEEEQNWSEFTKEAELGIVNVDDLDVDVDDIDPFDTGYVQSVVREKSIDDDDFDPRAGEQVIESKPVEPPTATLTVVHKDLLSGSTSDLTDLSHIPVIAASESIDIEIDPFDTSAISSLVQPKATEIKYLEKELLSDGGIKSSLSDPDFDPRADDPLPQPNSLAERKSSLSLNIASAHKAVVFNVGGAEALDDSSSDSKRKPLTPYYPRKSIEESGDISDSDFDPRAATPGQKTDLLSAGGSSINTKVLTPAPSSVQVEDGMSANESLLATNITNPFTFNHFCIIFAFQSLPQRIHSTQATFRWY